jgi:hypothetical protein
MFNVRLTDEEQALLQAMAAWKQVSMSDLARQYLRDGFLRDASATDVEAEIDRTIAEERQRLSALGSIIKQAAAGAGPDPTVPVGGRGS